MEQKIKIFENGEFGKVRTIIKDGEPWFVGNDDSKYDINSRFHYMPPKNKFM